jgi:hypothetical protein
MKHVHEFNEIKQRKLRKHLICVTGINVQTTFSDQIHKSLMVQSNLLLLVRENDSMHTRM